MFIIKKLGVAFFVFLANAVAADSIWSRKPDRLPAAGIVLAVAVAFYFLVKWFPDVFESEGDAGVGMLTIGTMEKE